jgi:asparagine synthase (glutamine-hydrolysing)
MHGFIGIIPTQHQPLPEIKIKWKECFDFQGEHITRRLDHANFMIEQFTANQFIEEKLWIDNDDFIFISEGLIYNLDKLRDQNSCNTNHKLIKKLTDNSNVFFNQFEGSFAGAYYNKRNNSWNIFNNQTGSKKLFYFSDKDIFIFSTDLYTLSQAMNTLDKKKSLHINAAYLLLTSGFMHEDLTLISEVKQLRAGECVRLTDNNSQIDSYFNLKDIEQNSESKKTIIETLDFKFRNAIDLEFELDKKYGYRHLTTLSGGLDSRMTALVAHENGFKNQTWLNFSEKGYADEIIAKKIATNYQPTEFNQIELNASGLLAIDNVISVNDGLTIYTGCSHVFSTLNQSSSDRNGIIHTGMLGDAIMGSYVSAIDPRKPQINDGLYSSNLLKKAEVILLQSIKNYPTEELYKFYNRAFLGVNNGFLFFDLIGEAASPFMNNSFLSYAYSIPRHYKYKENIYINWIKALHPQIANYTWENLGGKPTNNPYLRLLYRYNKALFRRLPIKSKWKNDMNPEQYWYDNNIDVKNTLDNYFNNHIAFLNNFKELRDDVIELYKLGDITSKAQALTLLGAYKLLFS